MSEFLYTIVVLLTFANTALFMYVLHSLEQTEESLEERIYHKIEECHDRINEAFMQIHSMEEYLGIRLYMKNRHYEVEEVDE